MIRTPAVAGSFYPADSSELTRALEQMTHAADDRVQALGIMVPHAGYVYSGAIAGDVFSRLQLPRRFILLGPNHTGMGRPLSIMCSGEWDTPIGRAPIDSGLARTLLELDPELEDDTEAHRMEHALEVELPFLQFLAGRDLTFVPIAVGTADLNSLVRLGKAVAQAATGSEEPVLIVASSDMNHYESDEVTRVKDRKAIDRVLARDGEGLFDVVLEEDISMCGFAPTVVMLTACNILGAEHAELVRYGTSGDIFGDRERVVGYAGITII
jgi:AmmeMemoRadiSam system protein B